MEGRERAGLKATETPSKTLNNNMSVNMKAEGIVVENIEKNTIVKDKFKKVKKVKDILSEVTSGEETEKEEEDQEMSGSEEENRLNLEEEERLAAGGEMRHKDPEETPTSL